MIRIITAQNVEKFLEPDVKKFSKEQLYGGVRSYLEDLIKIDEAEAEKLRNPESLAYKIFAVCEKEIIEREIRENEKLPYDKQKRSEYLFGFGDLLVKAKILDSHPYAITDRKLIN